MAMAAEDDLGPGNGYLLEPEWNEDELRQLPVPPVVVRPVVPDRRAILTDRLNGVVPVEEWCECQRCSIPHNASFRMMECCREQQFDRLRERLGEAEEAEGEGCCVTLHPTFEAVCLTADVLEIAVLNMREVRGYGANLEWTNR